MVPVVPKGGAESGNDVRELETSVWGTCGCLQDPGAGLKAGEASAADGARREAGGCCCIPDTAGLTLPHLYVPGTRVGLDCRCPSHTPSWFQLAPLSPSLFAGLSHRDSNSSLGTPSFPLGSAVQLLLQLLGLPRVLSPAVKPNPSYSPAGHIFPPVPPRASHFPPSALQSPLLTPSSQDCAGAAFSASPLVASGATKSLRTLTRFEQNRGKLLPAQLKSVSIFSFPPHFGLGAIWSSRRDLFLWLEVRTG